MASIDDRKPSGACLFMPKGLRSKLIDINSLTCARSSRVNPACFIDSARCAGISTEAGSISRRSHTQQARSHYARLLFHFPFHRARIAHSNLFRCRQNYTSDSPQSHQRSYDPCYQHPYISQLFFQLPDHSVAWFQWERPIPILARPIHNHNLALVHTDTARRSMATNNNSTPGSFQNSMIVDTES